MEKDILKFSEFIKESVETDKTFAYGLNRIILDNNDENTYEKILNAYFTNKVDRYLSVLFISYRCVAGLL